MAGNIRPYIIFDFETGGLDGTKNACTEIALLCLDGQTLEEVGRYESYISPYVAEYSEDALVFTGITMQLLNLKGKDIKVVGKEIYNWVKEMREKTGTTSYTKKATLVGHNVRFDIVFLKQLCRESKVDILSQFDCDKYDTSVPSYIDTQDLAKMAWGDDELQENFKLETCVGKIGSELADGHKAMNDVVATKDLLIDMVRRLRNTSSGEGSVDKRMRVRDKIHFEF